MAKSKIEWTDEVWNPLTGCDKFSLGCDRCYALDMTRRLKRMGQNKYRNGFKVTLHPDVLGMPYQLKKSKWIFVNSMSDLFHKDVPLEFIQKVFKTMNEANWHNYQVLTKRSERMLELSDKLHWSPNIWMGVTVEDKDYKHRIYDLRETGAHRKFLSLEPLIGDLGELDLTDIDWAIVAGESGAGAREMKADWVRSIRNQCRVKNVPFFFKQWGSYSNQKVAYLDGTEHKEMPWVVRQESLFTV